MPKPALIIGYGNPLRGDDGLGWKVAEGVATSLGEHAVILTVQQLTPELCEPIHETNLVIFVDASCDGVPGTWRSLPVAPAAAQAPALGHHCDLAGLLAYTQAVYQSCPKALVVSVSAETFDCRDALSPKVEAAIPVIVGYICNQVAALNPNPEPTYA